MGLLWIITTSCLPFYILEFFLGDDMTMEERPGTRQHVTFNIFGQSHAAINAAKKAMQQLCDNESTEIILNSEQDQVSIAKLTSAEVNAYLMYVCFMYVAFRVLVIAT